MNKISMSIVNTFIQLNFGSPGHRKERRKRNKGTQIGKEEVKLSLFVDDCNLKLTQHCKLTIF